MKKFLSIFLFAILYGGSAMAYDFSAVCESGQTLYYNITSNEEPYTVAVTSENTTSPYYTTYPTGDLEIPESVEYNSITYSVTSIGNWAFYECSGLASVTIPNSVVNIRHYAFENCIGLSAVYYTGDITQWCEISFGNYFSNPLRFAYNLYINNELVTNLVIPETISEIKEYAFYYASCLTSVNLGNSVTSIGGYAFQNCSGLTSVTIPNSVMNIGSGAFSNCSGLTEINIPDSVSEINWGVFSGCSGLTSVTIPNSVTSIGDYAFSGCSGLTSVTIGNSVENIGESSFQNCSGLIGELIIPSSVTIIGRYAFKNCSGLTSITIPNSVVSVGNEAFYGCSGLLEPLYNAQYFIYFPNYYATEYTIPNGIIHIASHAFEYCNSLTSVTIPNSVTSIGDYAFSGCSGLTSVTIGNSVTSIGWNAFYGCSRLTSVTIPNSVTSIRTGAFEGCSELTEITIGNMIAEIQERAFENTGWYNNQPNGLLYLSNYCLGYKGEKPTGNLLIRDGTRVIAWCSFKSCSSLTSITIPSSVTSIGGYAFRGCSGLTGTLTIPSSVTSIGGYAFSGCSGLTGTLTIPDSVTNISENAFSGCCGLTSLKIPNAVTNIGSEAFRGCSGINAIYSNATNPPAIYSMYTFDGIDSNVPIYVPCGRVAAYNSTQYWRNFTNIQQNPDCAGVEETEIANLQVFPNPVGSTLNITSDETISEIEIVNTLGQVVYRIEVNADNAVCDVEDLKAGVYVVRIHAAKSDTSTTLSVRRFVKE